MNDDDIFSTDNDTINIEGIERIIKFTRYQPNDPGIFMDGLELAEDLTTKGGTKLYTEGTEIVPQRIARIIKLRESNPNIELFFKIKRSAKLVQNFRSEIKSRMKEVLARRQKVTIYEGLLSQIGEHIESFVDDMLSDDNITLAIYKMKFICDSSETKRSVLFFNHSLNIAILSLAIASSERFTNILGRDKNRLIELGKAGLFHNYGAITTIDSILDIDDNKKNQRYWDANRRGYSSLVNLHLSANTMEAMRLLFEYYSGNKDLVKRKEWPATMANTVLVADIFLRKECGLFGLPQEARDIVDELNVKMMERKLNEIVVNALTVGLNFQDIFDFYQELQRLAGKCVFDKCGIPYPLTGLKSPTLFICKDEKLECEHIEKSLYAVTLVKPMGVLQPGKYRRCWLMTHLLSVFYDTHYREIKGSSDDKEKRSTE